MLIDTDKNLRMCYTEYTKIQRLQRNATVLVNDATILVEMQPRRGYRALYQNCLRRPLKRHHIARYGVFSLKKILYIVYSIIKNATGGYVGGYPVVFSAWIVSRWMVFRYDCGV